MAESQLLIPAEQIERSIRFIRGEKIMLDKDLGGLYGVATKVLVQAVKRNRSRFPEDFMFQLSADENEALRSQIVTLKPGREVRSWEELLEVPRRATGRRKKKS